MAIDFEREAQLDQERLEQEEQARQKRQARPSAARGIATQAELAVRVAHHLNAGGLAVDEPVGDKGFVSGFPSPIGALAEVAEAAERSAEVDERMERFPELRDVEVPTGNAARFPELAEESPKATVPEAEQDGEYTR